MERNFGGTQDDDGSMYNTSQLICLFTYVKIVKVNYKKNNMIREKLFIWFFLEDVLCDVNQEDITRKFNN